MSYAVRRGASSARPSRSPSAARSPSSAATAAVGRGRRARLGGVHPGALGDERHAGERRDRRLGEGEAGHPGLLEDPGARRDAAAAHQRGDDRARPASGGPEHGPGDAGGVRGRLRRHDDQRGVDLRIGTDGVQRVRVAGGVRVAHEVDGVPEARRARQHLPEPRLRGRVERRDLEPRVARGVRRDDPEPPAVGDDEKAAAARHRLTGEAPGQVEQLLDAAGPHSAGLPDGRLERHVRAREGARVGGDGAGALGGASGLEDDHRLPGDGPAEHLEEAPAVRQAFEVRGDHACLGIVARPPPGRRIR